MLERGERATTNCQGTTRRSLLRAGVLGLSGLTLADSLRASAKAQQPSSDRSVILVWLDGGPPQHETYDPKPDAPAEVRGPLGAIPTKIPGVFLSELFPLQAKLMDRISLIRSMHHNNGDHFAAAHWMLTGRFGSNAANMPAMYPSAGSVISKTLGPRTPAMPSYVGLPVVHSVGLSPGYHGAAYLGASFNPYATPGDPSTPNYRQDSLDLPTGVTPVRMEGRRGLLSAFDEACRAADELSASGDLDRFQEQAFSLLTSPAARRAFNIALEDPRLRDRYGRNRWGQSALIARRLVQAGVRYVTLTFDGWDFHANLEQGMKNVLPRLDAAVATLIEDLEQHGLLESTMVLVMGEFGRTPRINKGLPGIPVPGRDHWGQVMSVMTAGGGLRGGTVVGSSGPKGERPKDRPIRPQDLLATIYHQLGIDTDQVFNDKSGRPISILSDATPIRELV